MLTRLTLLLLATAALGCEATDGSDLGDAGPHIEDAGGARRDDAGAPPADDAGPVEDPDAGVRGAGCRYLPVADPTPTAGARRVVRDHVNDPGFVQNRHGFAWGPLAFLGGLSDKNNSTPETRDGPRDQRVTAVPAPDPGFVTSVGARSGLLAQLDPIVSPGRPSSHLHDFSGAHPTAEGRSIACFENPRLPIAIQLETGEWAGDTASFWFPALLCGADETPEPFFGQTWYYRRPDGYDPDRDGPIIAPPWGTRLVVDGDSSDAQGYFRQINTSLHRQRTWEPGATMPMVDRGSKLQAHIRFPGWWDGREDAPDHRSHFSFRRTAEHTIPVPTVGVFISWDTDGHEGCALASEVPERPGMRREGALDTWHADYWWGWDERLLQAFIDATLNTNGHILTSHLVGAREHVRDLGQPDPHLAP